MAKLVKLETAADMLFTPPAGYVTSTIGTDEEGLITELIKKSDGTFGTIGGGGGSSDGYVVVEVDGVLKAQKLAFDGTMASPDGSAEEIGSVGIFNTGMEEPAYKGMGGGSFYKCASVDVATWSGYEALIDGDTGVWSFSETVTTGLTYNKITPQVGKVYNEECTFMVSGFDDGIPKNNLVFYMPLVSDATSEPTSTFDTISPVTFENIQGINAMTKGCYRVKCPQFATARNNGIFSLSYWVKGMGYRALIALGSANNYSDANGEMSFCLGSQVRLVDNTICTMYEDGDTAWHHIVLTLTNNSLNVYKDGQLFVNNSIPTPSIEYDVSNTYMWLKKAPSGWNFQGTDPGETTDDGVCVTAVRIYDRCITEDEVFALYKEFIPVNE